MHEMHTQMHSETQDWTELHEKGREGGKMGTWDKSLGSQSPAGHLRDIFLKEGESNDGQEHEGKRSKTRFRTATESFMRRNKAADRRLERKIWLLYLAVRRKLTAEGK